MSFQSLSNILTIIQQRPAWTTYHQYCQVQTCWKSVISPKFLNKTRPVGISYQVLWVATESAAIAQHLTLQRYTLLKRLNRQLSEPLKDIRFSSVQWVQASTEILPQNPSNLQELKPNIDNSPSKSPETPKSLDQAFQGWANVIKQRSQQFPLCPYCHSPCELWELERWTKCSYCASLEK
jgi:predicted nucleic acid-binding Zn ribbon protein